MQLSLTLIFDHSLIHLKQNEWKHVSVLALFSGGAKQIGHLKNKEEFENSFTVEVGVKR